MYINTSLNIYPGILKSRATGYDLLTPYLNELRYKISEIILKAVEPESLPFCVGCCQGLENELIVLQQYQNNEAKRVKYYSRPFLVNL